MTGLYRMATKARCQLFHRAEPKPGANFGDQADRPELADTGDGRYNIDLWKRA
jgi:hypothetical protein